MGNVAKHTSGLMKRNREMARRPAYRLSLSLSLSLSLVEKETRAVYIKKKKKSSKIDTKTRAAKVALFSSEGGFGKREFETFPSLRPTASSSLVWRSLCWGKWRRPTGRDLGFSSGFESGWRLVSGVRTIES